MAPPPARMCSAYPAAYLQRSASKDMWEVAGEDGGERRERGQRRRGRGGGGCGGRRHREWPSHEIGTPLLVGGKWHEVDLDWSGIDR